MVSLGRPSAYAQSDSNPDHFETREPEPLPRSRVDTPAPRTRIHYAGNFTLPYTLECNHQSLASRHVLSFTRFRRKHGPGGPESEGPNGQISGNRTKTKSVSRARGAGRGTQRRAVPPFGDPPGAIGPHVQCLS